MYQQKTEKENMMKLIAAQNVIRNKFKKAYMNRIEHENDINHAIKPLHIESLNFITSSTNNASDSQHDIIFKNKSDDSNSLCDRLRLLLASQMNGNDQHTEDINSIITKLRESKILV